MMRRLLHLPSIVVGIALGAAGCATAGFPYKFYNVKDADFTRGRLESDKPENDLAFAVCAPTASDKNPCTCQLSVTFNAMKLDYQDTKNRLASCEQKLQECQP